VYVPALTAGCVTGGGVVGTALAATNRAAMLEAGLLARAEFASHDRDRSGAVFRTVSVTIMKKQPGGGRERAARLRESPERGSGSS
jgi:hypothetical protein